MEAWRTRARESQRAEKRSKERMPGKRDEAGGGALRALEALPQTPPGGKPPETPAPFPWTLIVQNGVNPSRVRKPRRNGAPLTDRLRSEERAGMRERGPCGQGQARAPTGGAGRRAARLRRCLILRQGTSPLRPPAPFPSGSMFQNGKNLSRVRKPRKNRAPLTDSFRSEEQLG